MMKTGNMHPRLSVQKLSLLPSVSARVGRPAQRSLLVVHAKLSPTIYRRETRRLFRMLITRQAAKTALHFLSETNGEMHLYLHNYLVDNPINTDTDGDAWLETLALQPLTRVKNPSRSSIPSAQSLEAVVNGEREVSPRELADRIMKLREYIAREAIEDLEDTQTLNAQIVRNILAKTTGMST